MNYKEYTAKRRQDPEYVETERRLKPILDLADDVFELRMERGWTQVELARRVRTRQANISRLENGMANPTFKFLQKLSQALGAQLTVRLRSQPVEEHTQAIYISQPIVQYVCVVSDEEGAIQWSESTGGMAWRRPTASLIGGQMRVI